MRPGKKKGNKRRYHRLGSQDLYAMMLRLMAQRKLYLDPGCSRETFARELMTNRTYVSRALNARGLTFTQFVNSYRTQCAVALLARRDLADASLGDIAEMSGFASVDRMNLCLKKSAGLTACALRKRLIEEK